MEFKKKLRKRLYIAIAYMVIGIVLTLVAFITKTDNYFISAFGIGLLVNSILRLRQYHRITRDEKSIKQQQIAEADERNRMLLDKAKSWAFYLYIMLTGTVLIILAILGIQDTLVQMIAYSICLLVILYWICYHILKRKY